MNRRFLRPAMSLALVFASFGVGSSSSPVAASVAPACQVWVTGAITSDLVIVDTWSSAPSTITLTGIVTDLTFNRSGTKVFMAMQSGGVKMIDVASMGFADINTGLYSVGTGPFGPIAASPTTDRIIATTTQRVNYAYPYVILNSETGATVSSSTLTERSNDVVFGPTGVAYSPWTSPHVPPSRIHVIDPAIPAVTATVSAGLVNADSFTSAAVAAPSGQTPILFVTSTDYTYHFLRAIDTVTATVAATVTLPGFASSLAVTPSGDRLFIAFGGLGQVRVLDSITRNVISTINVGSLPAGMAVTPDGRFLYVANQNSGSLSRVDLSTLTVDRTIAVDPMPTKVAIGPAGCVSVEPQTVASPSVIPISRVTMDPAGGECVDSDVARRAAWTSVFVGYRYLPGASDCVRPGYSFAGWARASSPSTVAAFPMLIDPSDGARRAFVAESAELVAVWTPAPDAPVAPSVFVALDGFFCTNCGVFLVWNDGVDDVIVTQGSREVCSMGVVRIGEWSLCHDPSAARGDLTYSLVATAGSQSSAPVVASVSR